MMIQPRQFFIKNEESIESWIKSRIGLEWQSRKVVQEIECGAGKSTLIPLWAYTLKRMGVIDKVIWIVPRVALAKQAAEVFEPGHWNWSQFGVTPKEADGHQIIFHEGGNVPNPSKGKFGYAICYDSIASNIELHIAELRRARYLVVLDEPQFAKVEKKFGVRVEQLLPSAAFSLIISGDFDVSGNERVASVDYVRSKDPYDTKFYVHCDLRYKYTDILSDNAALPIDFNYADGAVSYYNEKTEDLYEYQSLRIVEEDQVLPSLQAILKTEYAKDLLNACVNDWSFFRNEGITREGRYYPPFAAAQLLVVAGGISGAKSMYEHLTDPYGQWGFDPDEVVLVTSKDEDPQGKLFAFRKNQPYNGGSKPVRIAITVAMAYVGMDAPDISHICVLTFYRSSPWIHQMLARAWRLYQPEHGIAYHNQYCVAFVPPDRKLDEIIARIKDSIRIGWYEPIGGGGGGGGGGGPDTTIANYGALVEQWRLFALNPESVRAEAAARGVNLHDLENVRELLIAQGLPAEVVAEMMAVAQMHLERSRKKKRTAQEQYEYEREKLETYQKETVTQLMKLFGWSYETDKDKWLATKIFVSSRLKNYFDGCPVAKLDAPQVTEALNEVVPHLRSWCIENKSDTLREITKILSSKGGRSRAA